MGLVSGMFCPGWLGTGRGWPDGAGVDVDGSLGGDVVGGRPAWLLLSGVDERFGRPFALTGGIPVILVLVDILS